MGDVRADDPCAAYRRRHHSSHFCRHAAVSPDGRSVAVVAMVVALRTDPRREVRAEDPAFVIPILDILAGLGVSLTGPDRPCTLD